ncbi:MAG: hypothetical protein K5986_09575 [Clostridium sp.]|uniref:hypothetical protein n=1 Tax=Clostridium sp. DSM 8431 TaxID=1761781 RepID=UPI0008EAE132|nr:hypothetical protein [Clostridium sp. DSM 8431]MCR4944678.1 hypothetical protein [Clostridium sp.]SFU54358.1 PTS system, cellobiose-specific IIB component [Clostridium sp. DSM 8431]
MNNVLVISKSQPQSKSFEKFMNEYTEKNNLPIKWIYANDKAYTEVLEKEDVKVVIISPEVMLVQSKIMADLDSRKMPYIVIKPSAFGLKQTEKFMPDIMKYIEE